MTEPLRVRTDALEWREVDGEIVALDLRRSVYLAINPSGALLWPALVEGATRDDLVTRLGEEAGISPEVASEDVDRFLSDLAEHGLLDE